MTVGLGARAPGGRVRLVLAACAVAGALAGASVTPSAVDGQVRMRSNETALLREAANLESRGDLAGAATVLRRLLDESPGSTGGLYALERVLRAQGDVRGLLAPVDRYLERDATSSGVRYLKLRLLAELDSLGALRSEAEAWLASDPRDEVPYREVARVYERGFGTDEALAVLRRGRAAVGRRDALALEIGDVLAARGEIDAAVDEWAMALGEDPAQSVTITRRIQALDAGAPAAGRRLVAAMSASATPAAERAAARMALDLGLGPEAMALSRKVAAGLDERARSSFLADVARRAREQQLTEVAAWAYDGLSEDASTPAERRAFDERLVEVSLAAGDTVAALEAQRRLADSFARGTVDRRRATAQVIRLEGASGDPAGLRGMLADFRSEFPGAPELDDLAATVASALSARGDDVGARSILEGIDGPRSSLERGYLLLAEGDVEQGRSALLLAVTGLTPTDATPVIQFVGLLGRLSPEGSAALAEAAVAAHRGRGAEAAAALVDAVGGLAETDHAPILAEAARLAERGAAGPAAAEIRRRLLTEFADAPESAEASLALARWEARSPRGVAEAIRLLEDLITNRPYAAVVPDARVELERLRGRGS